MGEFSKEQLRELRKKYLRMRELTSNVIVFKSALNELADKRKELAENIKKEKEEELLKFNFPKRAELIRLKGELSNIKDILNDLKIAKEKVNEVKNLLNELRTALIDSRDASEADIFIGSINSSTYKYSLIDFAENIYLQICALLDDLRSSLSCTSDRLEIDLYIPENKKAIDIFGGNNLALNYAIVKKIRGALNGVDEFIQSMLDLENNLSESIVSLSGDKENIQDSIDNIIIETDISELSLRNNKDKIDLLEKKEINLDILHLKDCYKKYKIQMAKALVLGFKENWPEAWPTIDDGLEEVEMFTDDERICLVAVSEGKVLGWIGGISEYDGNVWELHPLVVAKEHRKKGIGKRLVHELEKEVKKRGGLTIQLGTDDESNMTSLSGVDLYEGLWDHIKNISNLKNHPYEFYEKLGYKIIGVMPDANGIGKPDIYMGKRVY